MAERNSTLATRYQGLNVNTVYSNDKVVTQFGNGTGNEQGIPPELSKILDDSTIPAYVDPTTYGVIQAYFISAGATKRNTAALTLLVIDSARIQGVSPMSLLEEFKGTGITLSDTILYHINLLAGSTTSRIGTVATKKNSNSYKSRLINPKSL